MSQPPVFGDPTAVSQQNRRSIFKGVGLGCGGCALVCLIGIGVVVALVFGLLSFFKNSDAMDNALAELNQRPDVVEKLGSPIVASGFPSGNYNSDKKGVNVDFTSGVSGPKSEGKLKLKGKCRPGGPWEWEILTLEVEGQTVDLLQVPAPPAK
jgi:hypothetical protein